MKKLCSLFLALILAVLPLLGCAEMCYSLQYLPEIKESDEPSHFFVESVMVVDLDWESVYHDSVIDTYISLPHCNDSVFAVLLTDGYYFVRGEIKPLGYATLYVAFKTDDIRMFLTRGAFLVIIGYNE